MLGRFLQKIFGVDGPTGEFGQFGSDNAGSQVTTKDPDEIQGLDAYYGQGLFPATNNHQEPPRIEDINGLYYLFTRQLAYLYQAGIAEWQTDTEYFADKSIVLASDGGIYIAITGTEATPNTGLEPSTHSDNWKLLITKSGVASGNPPLTRSITAGDGLSGGGDLSADRTLALDFEATATNIKMDGAQSVGTTTKAARSDHVHPTDTSRAPTVHASSGTTYGVGTTANYGHNKVINDLTHSSFANGESLAAYQGYLLDINKQDDLGISTLGSGWATALQAALTATIAELNFCDGVTSNIQAQLNAKQGVTAYSNRSETGYIKFSNGFIIQWGNATTAVRGTFPTSFTAIPGLVGFWKTTATASGLYYNQLSATTFTFRREGDINGQRTCNYIAVGF